MKNLFGIVLILMSFSTSVLAQTEINKIREANKNTKIALRDLIGNWHTADSNKSNITFVQLGNSEVLIDGIRDGVNDYRFRLDEDSVAVNGFAAYWPPYYCTLVLHDEHTLEIIYYQFHYEGTRNVTYKRKSRD